MASSNSSTTIVNIGPGVLQTGSGNPFVLSQTEWISIQKYVQDALALPLTQDQLRPILNVDSSVPIDMFDDMLTAYKALNEHCSTWKNTTFPNIVDLANDIVHYNTKVPVYYGGLQKVVDQYNASPSDELLKEITAIITNLASDASARATKAQGAADSIKAFADTTRIDQTTISNLYADYQKQYGSSSDEMKTLQDDIRAQKLIIESADAEYRHDVTIASTTPTYAWVPFIGWIAAAVVAGIYGHKAVEALHERDDAQHQLDNDNDTIRRDTNVCFMITNAKEGLQQILSDIQGALPVIQKIQGAWSAISSDLNNLVITIQTDIAQALPILMGLGIQEAISQWAQLATEADSYRVHAFVEFQGSSDVAA